MDPVIHLAYLRDTPLLDYESLGIRTLVEQRRWNDIPTQRDRIEAVYNFVRDEIPFAYPKRMNMSASQILHVGHGNCLTKTILLMALLRAVGVECRFNMGKVDKVILRGIVNPLYYRLAPDLLYHSWTSIRYKNKWIDLGGHVMDKAYISKLQEKFHNYMGSFYGYGIAVLNFRNPPIRWEVEDTAIQSKAIRKTLGSFDDPDSFFASAPQLLKKPYNSIFRRFIRDAINRGVQKIRNSR